jgi:exopolysaccharide biosynthesis protein
MKETLYEGVIYRRIVHVLPRPMVIHLISVDTKSKNIGFLVTPPDSQSERPLKARTTSQFLTEFHVQIAVNGDGFTPWWSHSLADYYPHVGDPITPLGFSASNGDVYWKGENPSDVGIEPTLYLSRQNTLSFNNRPGNVYNAISGDRMLVEKNEISADLDDKELDPRTAIGINRNGRYLYIMVVDGRQPFYSEACTFRELAKLMKAQGAYYAMSLDGGGSSTLVIEGEDGLPKILNSPIDNYIPGRERPVGNHLGIFIQ